MEDGQKKARVIETGKPKHKTTTTVNRKRGSERLALLFCCVYYYSTRTVHRSDTENTHTIIDEFLHGSRYSVVADEDQL